MTTCTGLKAKSLSLGRVNIKVQLQVHIGKLKKVEKLY